ncbi:N-acetylmuramoyl-L-alanine amidase, partial [Streptomyces albidoflavus]
MSYDGEADEGGRPAGRRWKLVAAAAVLPAALAGWLLWQALGADGGDGGGGGYCCGVPGGVTSSAGQAPGL